MDLVLKVSKIPMQGETIISEYFAVNAGGKGANQAVACSKLGGKVSMIGVVGNDLYGQMLKESLENSCVDISGVQTSDKALTGTAIVLIESNDNRIIVNQGANAIQNIDFITNFLETKAKKDDVLLSQLEIPVNIVLESLKVAKRIGMYTILNPAPVTKLPKEIYHYLDMLIPNEHEVEQLSGIAPNSDENLNDIRDFFVKENIKELIITLGADGGCYINDKKIMKFPAYQTKAIDTTAAGDTFIGAYVAQIASGASVIKAIDFASLASSITVSRIGAQQAIPTLSELTTYINDASK